MTVTGAEPSHWHAWVATGSLVLATWGTIAAQWATQSERTDTLRTQHLEQEKRIEKCEERIRTVENDRVLEQAINTMSMKIVALETTVSSMRDELKRGRPR